MSEIEHKRWSKEERAELKGFLGFSSEEYFLYTPKIYRKVCPEDKSKWPVFKLKGLNGLQVAKVQDQAGEYSVGTDKMVFTTGSQRIKTLESNILGWKNLFDNNDQEIEFKDNKGKVHILCLEKIPAPLQVELQEAINERSYLTEEELEGLDY